MLKSLEAEENGLNVNIQGKKWGTYFVLFQKHVKCTELHNTVYCSEAASGGNFVFNNILALKKPTKIKVLRYEAEYKVLGFT